MKSTALEPIIQTVLYEGYLLYPYRASGPKNQRERFTFGRIYPRAYSEAQRGAEPASMQTECLVLKNSGAAEIELSVRFLQPMWREVGVLSAPQAEWKEGVGAAFQVVPEIECDGMLYQTWQEAVERKVSRRRRLDAGSESVSFRFAASRSIEPIREKSGSVRAVFVRRTEELQGKIELTVTPVSERLSRITVRTENQTSLSGEELGDSGAVMMRTFASCHTVVYAEGGEFVSLMDPPAEWKEAAATCRNVGTWPVLVGDEARRDRDTMLSSPIILYDYPKVAPESSGDFFDGTEIDEMLTLRILTMTDREKREMRSIDAQARSLLDRAEALPQEDLLKLHGTLREWRSFDDQVFGSNKPLEGIPWNGAFLTPGVRVRIRPKARADVMDMALTGRTAVIEAIEQDAEERIHLALVLDDDPGKDLGLLRQPGHRFFYGVEEVEPLSEAATSEAPT
jgi:hypothetical protein